MLLFQIIIATIIVSLISLVGVFAVYRKKSNYKPIIKMIISLAAGSLLAISFLDLLPESLDRYSNPHTIMTVTLLSFLAFFLLEKFWHWHHCRCIHDDGHYHDREDKRSLLYTNLIGDGIHNFTDGFLIASAFMLNFHLGIITTFAVILHEIPQEISDFGILLYGGLTRSNAILFNLLTALTAIVGGVSSYLFGQSFQEYLPLMTAFAAGNFIYLASADLIPELQNEKSPNKVWQHTLSLMMGVIIIFLLKVLVPEAQ